MSGRGLGHGAKRQQPTIASSTSRAATERASPLPAGGGPPLLIVPTMADTIETSWALYSGAFVDRELITYDRRGSGLSERGPVRGGVELFLQDVQAVIAGFGLRELDVLGTLLGTTEAAWVASLGEYPIRRLVLRAPTLGLKDWASIPGVSAALAAMEHDWEFFTESFAQFIVGWGHPNGPNTPSGSARSPAATSCARCFTRSCSSISPRCIPRSASPRS